MEVVALLTTAKELGFESGSILSLVVIYFMLKKFVTKQNTELKEVLNTQVDKMVKAIGQHNERLDGLESDVKLLKRSAIMRSEEEKK
jgi:hypothetical protein